MWRPAPRGVKGNEIEDSLAVEAIMQDNSMEISLSKAETKAQIRSKNYK